MALYDTDNLHSLTKDQLIRELEYHILMLEIKNQDAESWAFIANVYKNRLLELLREKAKKDGKA